MSSLETRFATFMATLPSVEVIDSLDLEPLNGAKKADYLALGRQIVIEQKCITQDQTEKMQLYLEQFQGEDWYPRFYGERDINQILKYFPNPEEAKSDVFAKITKLVEDYFKTANSQIFSTKRALGTPAAFGVLVILNDSVRVLSPNVLGHSAYNRLLQIRNEGSRRFHDIDLVFIFCDTHLVNDSNPLIIRVDGPKKPPDHIEEFLKYLLLSWGCFNGGQIEFLESDQLTWGRIKEKNDPPLDKLKRNDGRIQRYRANPYLRNLTNQEVIEFGARIIEKLTHSSSEDRKNIPVKITSDASLTFGDFLEEANFRGLDLRALG